MEVGSGHHYIPIWTLFLIIPLQKPPFLQGFFCIVCISNIFLLLIRINQNWGHNGGIFCRFHNHMPPPLQHQTKGKENHASL